MSTADKLNKLLETKQAIKQAIIDKGVEVADDTVFADYPAKINAIQASGGDTYYEDLFIATTADNTNYGYLFYNCNKETLDLSRLDTSKVGDMRYMFQGCGKLTSLDLSNFNTSDVVNMSYMFEYCTSLPSLDLSNFDTSKVTTMLNMFSGCRVLTSLDLSNFNTSKVNNMSYMFYNCYKLTSIDVSSFDTSNVTNISSAFNNCTSLTTLDCSNWDLSKVTANYYFSDAFNKCPMLVDFNAPKNISANMSVSDSTALSHDSLMSIINNLITTTSTKTLTLGETNLAKLTAEEIAIATNKGWTVK